MCNSPSQLVAFFFFYYYYFSGSLSQTGRSNRLNITGADIRPEGLVSPQPCGKLLVWRAADAQGGHSGTHPKTRTHTYLSERLQHLRGLVLLALLGHEHHLLDHADATLVGRRRRPAAAQTFSRLEHEGGQDVAALLGGRPLPAVLWAGPARLLAFGLLGPHVVATSFFFLG